MLIILMILKVYGHLFIIHLVEMKIELKHSLNMVTPILKKLIIK